MFPLFLDLNECTTGSHNCDHKCNNTFGGFECSCYDGFVLSSNQATCIG